MATVLYGLIEQRRDNPNFGEPFYVGIGTAKRPHQHLRDARSIIGHNNRRVQSVFDGHFTLGMEPLIMILDQFEDRIDAALAEIDLIATYGRIGIEPDGTLCNLARGGEGPDPLVIAHPEIREKLIAALRANWRNPEIRQRRLEILAKTNAAMTTEQRAAAQMTLPEDFRRARASNATIIRNAMPGMLEQIGALVRAANLESWKDEDIRARRTNGMRGVPKTMTPEAIAARQANANAPRSEEALKAQLDAVIRMWADPDFRAKRSADMKALWEDPEQRARFIEGRSEGIAESWKDPEVRAKRTAGVSAAIKDKWANDSDYAERSRAGLRDAWTDPEKKAIRVTQMLETRAINGVVQTEEGSARHSEVMKGVNAKLTFAQRSAIQTKNWSDPERLAKRSAAMKVAAQDPALKAARVANMLEGKRRKAAARAAERQVLKG